LTFVVINPIWCSVLLASSDTGEGRWRTFADRQETCSVGGPWPDVDPYNKWQHTSQLEGNALSYLLVQLLFMEM